MYTEQECSNFDVRGAWFAFSSVLLIRCSRFAGRAVRRTWIPNWTRTQSR